MSGDVLNSPIFIVGTGRSGTHFLLSVLMQSSEITDIFGGTENLQLLFKSVNAAIHGETLTDLHSNYWALVLDASPLRFVDKTHPNLWHITTLADSFSNVKFLGLVRDPFSVVYSTLNHNGTKGRLTDEAISGYPVPCPFFGIEGDFIAPYTGFSIAQRAALRWCSHMKKINHYANTRSDFIAVRYESLLLDPVTECEKIGTFLELSEDLCVPNPMMASLHKKNMLSATEKSEIRSVVEAYFNFYGYPNEDVVPLVEYLSWF